MVVFILFTLFGIAVIMMAETLHNQQGNDREGLIIVKCVVLGIPVLAGLLFLQPAFIVVSIAIVVFKSLLTYYLKKI